MKQPTIKLDVIEFNHPDIEMDLSDEIDYEIKKIGTKVVYPTNGKDAQSWVREDTKGITGVEYPHMSSFNRVTDKCNMKLIKGAIGFFVNLSNSVYKNTVGVSIFSGIGTQGNAGCGFSVISTNFLKVVALFCARKTIAPTWINCKDEYLIPNIAHPEYDQWNKDAIVYALFNNSSQQSSLRGITYKGKKWDILNQFFFMSNEEMKALADEIGFDEMYQDATANGKDRFVYSETKTITLSQDAQEVLEKAKELIRKSMKARKLYHEEHPEYHLSSWDAGWAQMKPMFKEYHKEEYDSFVKLYKKFEDRMREGVYKFGFLK